MQGPSNSVIVPWINSCEFEAVYHGLFGGCTSAQKQALARINVWKSRCILPVAVESTDALIKVYINEHEGKKSGLNMEDSIRNAYSLAIIRFVNHITERSQVKQYMQAVHRLAGELGVPEWIVNLRHDATHGRLPSLDLLKTAADWCIQWLKDEYWEKQLEGMAYQQEHPMKDTKDTKVKDNITEMLNSFKIKKTLTSKKRGSKTTQILKNIEVELLRNREKAVTLMSKIIEGQVKKNVDAEDTLSFWHPVLKIYHQYGLTLSMLKCLPVTDGCHGIISSFLYQLTDTGCSNRIVEYFDFVLSSVDQYSVLCLLQKLDLNYLLPENKANQLKKIMDIYSSHDQSNQKGEIYHVKDLPVGEAKEISSESSWKLFTDHVNWNEFPIGCIPGCNITYGSLRLGDTTPENQVDESLDQRTVDDMEYTQDSSINMFTVQDSFPKNTWTQQEMNKIQHLVQIL
ncbi:ribosomal biogenesis protein LAS1 [Mytilus galloprovincialis]|uniref:Ribosomal biogenesis protein LAS1 n=1 Tax=Mytilus galloprovincialis TaxID=29158 RepID=A0A8B6FQT5_MYTGA|nr:ribosomal biogenesis protein LAS1 [Mytilus galloprovincialis]